MLRLLLVSMSVAGQAAPGPEVVETRPQAGTAPRAESSDRAAEGPSGGASEKGPFPPSPVFISEVLSRGFHDVLGDGRAVQFGYPPLAGNLPGQASDLALSVPDDVLRSHLKLPEDRGLVVVSAAPEGPAWQAGVRGNDILLTLDGRPLARPEDLDRILKEAAGKPLALELLHEGKRGKLTVQAQVRVTLGPVASEERPFMIGVEVAPLGAVLRSQLGLPGQQGLIVRKVTEGGPAARAQIKVDDVILSVDGQPQNAQATLFELVQKAGGKPMTIELIREGDRLNVQVTPEQGKDPRQFGFTFFNSFPVASVLGPGVVQGGSSKSAYADAPFHITFIPGERRGAASTPGRPRVAQRQAQTDPDTFKRGGLKVVGQQPSFDASADRLDAMAAEVKELRRAVDELREALERKP